MSGSNGFINEGMFSFARATTLATIGACTPNISWIGNSLGPILLHPLRRWWNYQTPFNDLQLDIYAGYDLSETFGTRLPTTGWFIGTG